MATLFLAVGHIFFIAETVQAYEHEQTSSTHYDTTTHESGHISCEDVSLQFLSSRFNNISSGSYEFAFDGPRGNLADFDKPWEFLVLVLRSESTPPRLPLAQKTQLLI